MKKRIIWRLAVFGMLMMLIIAGIKIKELIILNKQITLEQNELRCSRMAGNAQILIEELKDINNLSSIDAARLFVDKVQLLFTANDYFFDRKEISNMNTEGKNVISIFPIESEEKEGVLEGIVVDVSQSYGRVQYSNMIRYSDGNGNIRVERLDIPENVRCEEAYLYIGEKGEYLFVTGTMIDKSGNNIFFMLNKLEQNVYLAEDIVFLNYDEFYIKTEMAYLFETLSQSAVQKNNSWFTIPVTDRGNLEVLMENDIIIIKDNYNCKEIMICGN